MRVRSALSCSPSAVRSSPARWASNVATLFITERDVIHRDMRRYSSSSAFFPGLGTNLPACPACRVADAVGQPLGAAGPSPALCPQVLRVRLAALFLHAREDVV